MGKFGDHKLKSKGPLTAGVYVCEHCDLELDAVHDSPDVINEKERKPCHDEPARPAARPTARS